ncbi:MAG TPA: peptidase [Cyanobacteria bacterium UBA11369]|nr:peptidase [Cyanobacteria bacterium UBA8553]HAZ43967.1 peptidase [Cyanobacteria bacterium UBA11371]HBE52002.1 peptidase [Cyanobacteria bacterium UBA11369]
MTNLEAMNPPGSEGGMQQVIVEMRVPQSQGTGFALQMAQGMNVPGFQLDTSYDPVPMSPSEEQAARLAAANEEVVIVRGTIEASRIPELEAQPHVLGVWRDSKVTPFSTVVAPEENKSLVQPLAPLAACPIGTCDCTPRTAKGTISDVAKYLGVDQIWSMGIRGDGIVVGVVDGGITAEGRPVVSGETSRRIPRVIGGWPTSDWGTRASAWGEHGNMCATDVLGMAPQAQIYDIRISNGDALSNALAGFQWAINQHKTNGTPHILTNSWGYFQENWDPDYTKNPNHPFTRKVVEALDEGILVLFAAGNCGGTCPDSRCGSDTGPGRSIWGANGHPRVMTVGAVNINEQFVGYSSQGPAALDPQKPDFCSITHFRGYFDSDSGTSAATPIAAGVVALLKQGNSSATQDEIKKALKDTAKDIGESGWDRHSGAGIIRGKAAFDTLTQIWRNNVKIRGLWAINQDRNAWVYVNGLGWRKISPANDNIFFNMLVQLAAAKAGDRSVNFLEQLGVVKQIYVW